MSAIVCDNLVDGNIADADGTTLDATKLGSATQGFAKGTWTLTGTAPTITSSNLARLDQAYTRGNGTNFASGSTHRRIRFSAANALSYCRLGGWTGYPPSYRVSCGGWVTLGPADAGAGGVLFDLVAIADVFSNGCVFQLNNGNGGGGSGYAVNVESSPGGVTTHSTYFTVTPGSTHWVSLQVDTIAFTYECFMYDTSGNQEFHVTGSTNSASGGGGFSYFQIGNAESGTSTGNLDFENFCLDFKGASPVGPVGPSNYWIEKFDKGGGGNPPGTGSASSVTCQVDNVSAGDLAVVMAKWEGGAGSSISCSDGTSSLTASTVTSTTGQANTSGDPRLAIFYLLSSVATGTLTYTVTIGASRTFRDMAVLVVTKPSGSGALALDGTNTGNTAASGTALTSTNQTTTGTNGMSFGGYAEFGATLGQPLINSKYPDAAKVSAVGNSAIWCCAYTAGFTGAAAGTLSGSNRWNAQIISFSAAAATVTIDMWGSVQTTPMVRRRIGVVPSGTIGIKS